LIFLYTYIKVKFIWLFVKKLYFIDSRILKNKDNCNVEKRKKKKHGKKKEKKEKKKH
jgi:hypothetical protein